MNHKNRFSEPRMRPNRHRNPALIRLNNKIEDIFYEMGARVLLKSGLLTMPDELSHALIHGELTVQQSKTVQSILGSPQTESEMKQWALPMIRAISDEAVLLGMQPEQLTEAILAQMRKHAENINGTRLWETITRIEAEQAEQAEGEETRIQ